MPVPRESSPTAGPQPDASLEVCDTDSEYGLGVRTLVPRHEGEVIHHFTGVIGPELKQHTLQVSPGLHISETEIIGFLSHSCAPDCRLDMAASQLVALRDIRPGDLLTIDYAETEDVLYRQFACHCGAAGCRRWITGRLEAPNADGRAHLAALTS
ncbi:MAG: SET domain-containing protein-lysine N-methyltransferase [Alphaproteobacteria bacterium]|nr:SET domain-containing protein-lysine N-methyltransferase [Alphaproteobacteria bacterium]MBU1516055.1 SET domain-containing protein-lysine N-methyltransferase [Alphaproteobacteria bacterium]MBU2092730.1 SET domain-containing protein-lysine N-methyltransferase [Alphaproteobacteria bacterium]MBU2153745.1 SET domain-containing protein-lysine N-methyltransferase [Alphaproteobacteria bacterium]MBU2308373.1 SET domain-containing protein-lysine N-methyltransferase [Alphaproteobacteria bacterium]